MEAGKLGDFLGFVSGDLIPYLKSLAHNPNATARQKIIGEVLSGVEKTRVDRSEADPLSALAPFGMGAHYGRILAVDGVERFRCFVAAVQRNAIHPQLAMNCLQDGWSSRSRCR